MNLPGNVSDRMEYIQKLFLDVEQAIEEITDLDQLITLLDREAPEFRSIAYESASMVIGSRDLYNKRPLDSWKEFRQACTKQHSFHTDIGLGWAFAKTDIQPGQLLELMNPVLQWMVFDGIGYYYGLFKGRNTIKNKIIPAWIEGESVNGFDQGVGRRLWYIARGNINELVHLIEGFDNARHADLWRGVGIAGGYVGGNTDENLSSLVIASGVHNEQLKMGIILATISRIASNSINTDVQMACRIICNKTIEELKVMETRMAANFFYLYKRDDTGHWFSQPGSEPGNKASPTIFITT